MNADLFSTQDNTILIVILSSKHNKSILL